MKRRPSDEIVYENFCCPLHSNTCGLKDWCCDGCPDAGSIPGNFHNGRGYGRIACYVPQRALPEEPEPIPEFPRRAMTDENGGVVYIDAAERFAAPRPRNTERGPRS